jgi:hypothetical protein
MKRLFETGLGLTYSSGFDGTPQARDNEEQQL